MGFAKAFEVGPPLHGDRGPLAREAAGSWQLDAIEDELLEAFGLQLREPSVNRVQHCVANLRRRRI